MPSLPVRCRLIAFVSKGAGAHHHAVDSPQQLRITSEVPAAPTRLAVGAQTCAQTNLEASDDLRSSHGLNRSISRPSLSGTIASVDLDCQRAQRVQQRTTSPRGTCRRRRSCVMPSTSGISEYASSSP